MAKPSGVVNGQDIHQIRNDITFGLEFTGIKWNAACRLRPYTDSVIYIVVSEAGGIDLIHRKVFGQLVNDNGNHLQVCQFFSAYIGCDIAHLKKQAFMTHHRNNTNESRSGGIAPAIS